jgi:DNA end-binding protein Ku
MEEAGKVAIGRFVLRTRQQLCALRPAGGVLVLSTMLYGDEVNAPDRLDELDGLADVEANAREVAMAGQLIESLSTPFDPKAYRDEYRERVLDLIDRKAAGEEVAVQPAAAAPAAVPDLMAALEASVAAVRGNGRADGIPKLARRRRAKAAPASARARARAKSRG